MGLDMHLNQRVFVIGDNKGTFALENFGEKRLYSKNNLKWLIYEVGYWRKANHIHKWFVDNVQEGVDDCREYDVGYEQLLELKRLCETALKVIDASTQSGTTKHTIFQDGEVLEVESPCYDSKLVEDILPPQDGFFFGSTVVDHNYIEDCKMTIDVISKLASDGFYTYESSW